MHQRAHEHGDQERHREGGQHGQDQRQRGDAGADEDDRAHDHPEQHIDRESGEGRIEHESEPDREQGVPEHGEHRSEGAGGADRIALSRATTSCGDGVLCDA